MRSRVFRCAVTFLAISVAFVGGGSTAIAQLRFVADRAAATPANGTPLDKTNPAPEVADILDRGRRLEGERRWGEAFTLYEDAIREFPAESSLEKRLEISRVHYDLGRRYGDPTYRESLDELNDRSALDLYAEVLLKLQSYYVESPRWRQLFDQGAYALEIALGDPLFLETNLPEVSVARVERFRRELRGRFASAKIESRLSARDAVSRVARLARTELGLAEKATVMEYVCGATNSLDPYSSFLTPGQLDEVYSQIEGNFVGLGIELKAEEGRLSILKVISGSPAERSGIKAGDRIVEVDGHDTRDYSTDQAANMLQGPEGSIVEVTVDAPGHKLRRLRVRREHVDVPSVDRTRIVDEAMGIGYLRLTCFQKTTSRDLDAALAKLKKLGMRSLIVDVRGNPGGLLTTAVEVVDKFVEAGVIVSTRGRGPQEDYTYSAHPQGDWRLPMVVLIDGESASASEIFAGAIRDHRRGTLVGARTYGKGSVQGIFPLNHGKSGLRLTTAKFFSPKGRPFSKVGVDPDLVVHEVAKAPLPAAANADDDEESNWQEDEDSYADDEVASEYEPDAALEAAIGAARRQLARR